MAEAEGVRELAAALAALKGRSGLSYQELGRRLFTSRSTLHRYCTGRAVPGDYGLLVRIAEECGAGPEELNDLLRHWRTATGRDQAPTGSLKAGGSNSPAHSPSPAIDSPKPRPNASAVRLVLAAIVALFVLSGAAASSPGDAGAERTPAPAAGAAASWAEAPKAVEPEVFGVTMNSSSGAMPSFRVGSLRLWDSETRWAQLEPKQGKYDWSTLDRLLNAAEREGLPTLFVFGGTPAWAAPDARKAAYPDGSRAAPPDDLADWDTFVRALVRHAGDRIDAYELWVMANHPHHYNGSVRTLVEMTRRASAAIQAADPDATVVCPSVTGLWDQKAHEYLLRFAEAGGYQYCDAAGVKLYQRHVTDPPETMLDTVLRIERTFHRAGYHLPVWSTGTTQSLPLNDPLDEDMAADHAVRFYLTGLYARNHGVARLYFYAWGNGKLPLVLQAEGQPPTKAGRFVGRLQQWLSDARLRGCGNGPQASLPDNVWECEFRVPDTDGRLRTARARWTHTGTAEVPNGPGAKRVHRLDGSVQQVRPGDVQLVTERPVLIEYG
ncbi:helix-turn-helix domain-containing protein [Streptomyces sp. AC550_RSS872]|uniref:helix-turn-helix domain-containing protein n=1 Tax=Streptomyces sp. AC550_RSS872 TaxID=2823689 RepID=UPI0027E41263|nr:helix-turn-helix domain-containing protein [Streptomyces sp. AC550_RSS872]